MRSPHQGVRPDWPAIERETAIAVRSAEFIGEGWIGMAYRVNDEMVFKFPKRAEDWTELDREIVFLAYAAEHLPLAVPHHLLQLRESGSAPFGYIVYKHIPGEALDVTKMSSSARDAVARTLAEFLKTLHALKPGTVTRVLPKENPYQVAMEHSRGAEERIVSRLTRVEQRALAEFFRRNASEPQSIGRARVLHADFSGDHILCVGDEVAGIIDWGDVSLGDADYDFGYLYEEFGEAFVRQMAEHYGHPDPDRLVRKARYFTFLDQLGTILYGGERAPEGDMSEAWRRLRALLREGP
jgi:aminoglycoside 2''-phosphotransferase